MTLRAVVDTNLVVSGLGWAGPPGQVLDAAVDGRFILVTSVALLDELRAVLARSKLADRFPAPDDVADRLAEMSVLTDPQPTARVLADQADNRLVEAAHAGGADLIVTGDRLVADADPIGRIRVVTAAEFLMLLERLEST